jgi:hypothetical protein
MKPEEQEKITSGNLRGTAQNLDQIERLLEIKAYGDRTDNLVSPLNRLRPYFDAVSS